MRPSPITLALAACAGVACQEEEPSRPPFSFPIGQQPVDPGATNPTQTGPVGTGLTPTGTTPNGCSYPPGAVEPMAEGSVLAPYRWPNAIHRGTGQSASIDLAEVPCATDPDIDWSPHDVLVFVSIPAW